MTLEELRQLVTDVRRRHSELDNVEVKAARGGTPRRLYESLSAFANRTGGGVLLFGLDEGKDFSIVGVGNAQRLQEELTHLASAEMEPALRPQFVVRPTLAGLLMFGKYPQEFFPQLMITFLQYYGTTEDEHTPRGERFMDNQRFEGPIPEMVEQSLSNLGTPTPIEETSYEIL